MSGLPPLGERVQDIRQGKAATTASENDRNFARSQDEYKKGISSWNFDVTALKAQAAMEPDVDDEPALPTITEADENVDSTLSGLAASQAASFIQAQQQGVRSDSSGGGAAASTSVSFQPNASVFGKCMMGCLQPTGHVVHGLRWASGCTFRGMVCLFTKPTVCAKLDATHRITACSLNC